MSVSASNSLLDVSPLRDKKLLNHRDLRDDDFWREIPAYAQLNSDEFNDHRFQSRNCVTSLRKLQQVLGDRMDSAFYGDVEKGVMRSIMSLRISPYLISL